mgnify:FL=1|jgi:hypothetical protein
MNKLKMFVNNPELWESFVEELEVRLEANHKQLEQITETEELHRLQGVARTLRAFMRLRDDVNGS